MASIIDLTYDDSSDENNITLLSPKNRVIKTPSTRQPLNPIQNNVQLPSIHSVVPNMDLNPALTQALKKASEKRVRQLLMRVCRENPASRALVEREFLVPKREVVPYHADTDSEDVGIYSEDDEEEESEDENEPEAAPAGNMTLPAPNLKRKADSVDDELFPRFAKSENCKEEFDVTMNVRGDCVWHPGKRQKYP